MSDRAIDQARRRVLAGCRRLGLFAGLPFLLLLTIQRWVTSQRVLGAAVELLAMAGVTAFLWWDRERRPRLGGQVLLLLSFVVCVGALVQFGPLLWTGALLLAWSLAVVFFLEQAALGVAVAMLTPLGMGLLIERGMVLPPWPNVSDGLLGWLRMSLTLGLICSLGSLIFRQLLAVQQAALEREAQARLREREAYAEADRAHSIVAASSRLEVLGRLAGHAAHEFNNHFMSVIGCVDLLRGSLSEGERRELLGEIELAVGRAKKTGQQLLAFAHQGSNPVGQAAPAEALAQLTDNLQQVFEDGPALRLELVDTPPVTLASGALQRMLLELCLAARDQIGGQPLSVRLRHRPELARPVEIEFAGVKKAPLALTPQFDQLLRSADGEFETAEGDTTWRLKLPVRAPASIAPLSASELKTVVVLEDDPSIRRVLLRILEREGYSVTPSACVAEALVVIESANFDLLIADAKLPDGDSSGVIRRFRERNATSRILVCSGFIEGDGVLAEVQSLGVAFLQKPFGQQRLLATLGALQAPKGS